MNSTLESVEAIEYRTCKCCGDEFERTTFENFCSNDCWDEYAHNERLVGAS